MRRRDVLRTAAATGLALPLSGPAAARQKYAPLGSVPLPQAKEAVVSDDGRTAFVAVTDGFAVVDLSEPAAPTVVYENREVLADHERGPLTVIYDVRLDGDLLAVTGPANPKGASILKGVAVYDVSDRASPERVSFHRTDFFNHNCHVADGIVYLCGNNGVTNPLVTVDARTGEELGRWSITEVNDTWRDVRFIHWPLHDLWVQDSVAYLAQWDAGTWMVDVSDPANPSLVARVRGRDPEAFVDLSEEASRQEGREPPGNDHFVMPNDDGSLLAIGVESWDETPDDPDSGGPGGIFIYDVSDPKNATELSHIPAPRADDESMDGVWTTSHNFDFDGERLYTSWYRGGVKLFDVSDPSSPREVVAWADRKTTSFWTAQRATDTVFVGSSRLDPSIEPKARQSKGAALYTFPSPPPHTETPTDGGTDGPGGSPGDGSTDVGAPGFGPAAALAGVGIGAWRHLRRER